MTAYQLSYTNISQISSNVYSSFFFLCKVKFLIIAIILTETDSSVVWIELKIRGSRG